jgi:hypothetical protein
LKKGRDKARTENDASTPFYSDERTETVFKAIIGVSATVLLILPVFILYILTVHHASGGVKIGASVKFVVAFTVALATLTKASRQEMFGASAAYQPCHKFTIMKLTDINRYSAVLVVFLGHVLQIELYALEERETKNDVLTIHKISSRRHRFEVPNKIIPWLDISSLHNVGSTYHPRSGQSKSSPPALQKARELAILSVHMGYV